MTREIKFRVWDDSPEVQGFLDYDSVFLMANGSCLIDDVGEDFDMSTTTIETYTGMTDNNGVEIYEGDVLMDVDNGTVIGSVEYINDSATYWCGYNFLSDVALGSQICGNIHEDPELLEAKK